MCAEERDLSDFELRGGAWATRLANLSLPLLFSPSPISQSTIPPEHGVRPPRHSLHHHTPSNHSNPASMSEKTRTRRTRRQSADYGASGCRGAGEGQS